MNADDDVEIELADDLLDAIRRPIERLTTPEEFKTHGEHIRRAQETLRQLEAALSRCQTAKDDKYIVLSQTAKDECIGLMMRFDEDLQRLGLPGFIPSRG